jgi:REP element-mobilizing transposase RayT
MISFSRRHLPHYDAKGSTYFVTACLAGSIPTTGLHAIRRRSEDSARGRCPVGVSPSDWKSRVQAESFELSEDWLDVRPATQWLKDRRLASIVRDEMMRHAGVTYVLHAYVVMPSHFHCVFTPVAQRAAVQEPMPIGRRAPRSAIMRSIKGNSALACNRVLRREGAFWQSESYDRVVRDEEEFERVVQYVENNPVKAGLCRRPEDWEFSSARRAETGS